MALLAFNAQDAWPELSSKVETFTAIAGTGSQQITTTGFQPKAVLLWITDRTAVGNGAVARFGRGWTDGTRDGGNRYRLGRQQRGCTDSNAPRRHGLHHPHRRDRDDSCRGEHCFARRRRLHHQLGRRRRIAVDHLSGARRDGPHQRLCRKLRLSRRRARHEPFGDRAGASSQMRSSS